MANPLEILGKVLTGGGGDIGKLLMDVGTDYLIGRVVGGKEGGKAAAISSLLGQGIGNIFSQGAGGSDAEQLSPEIRKAVASASKATSGAAPASAAQGIAKAATERGGIESVFKQGEGTLGYAKLMRDLGLMKDDNPLLGALNSKAGEAIATMLVSGLGSKLFDQEEGPGPNSWESRPFGGTRETIGIRGRNKGGYIQGEYFPKRNGGIMPSEGSGTRDDVPAMLTAGEFVLTRDAVKGLGNGSQERGIQNAYKMMHNLERRA